MSGRNWKLNLTVAGVALALTVAAGVTLLAQPGSPQERRAALNKTYQAGNYKDAYLGLRKLALDPQDDQLKVGDDLTTAIECLRRLGRVSEIDDFREAVIAAHNGNWRLLQTAANTYRNVEHHGYIVAGKFERGYRRSANGRMVHATPRDRVRALQLMQDAFKLVPGEKDKSAAGQFYLDFATMLQNGAGYHEPWRLQYLTDLSQLPDYEDGWSYNYRGAAGAPVDKDGNPVYHHLPASYEKATTDGQRWRWLLAEAARIDPARASQVDVLFANFLRDQFGVQSMAQYDRFFRGSDEDRQANKSGTYALHTLKETETIAKLANGIRRFDLPDEFNWIKVYRRAAERGKSKWGEQARDSLASVFENRRQYTTAADAWRLAIADYGPGDRNWRSGRLDQIVANWGRFEPGQVQPAGKDAVVDFRFRNGNKVSFEAHALKVDKLLGDVKAYLRSSPNQLDWQALQINNIGYRLVERQELAYLGAKVAAWDVDLKPRPGHVDALLTLKTPLTKPGAYLVKAQMANGNLSRIVVWVSDTVLLKKQLPGQAYYFVADAVTGQPVAGAAVEFFGWKQINVQPNRPVYKVVTSDHSAASDADGQVFATEQQLPTQFQWLAVARKAQAGQGGADRFAYLGFSNVWYGRQYDADYNATRTLIITDRPVYRPLQTAQFKAWVRHAKYDQADKSDFAGQEFKVRILDPKRQKFFEKNYSADAYGGLAGQLPLPKEATLGVYQVQVLKPGVNQEQVGWSTFRVEEYKKPEFEVKVEAPKEPVRLGEQIVATVQAKYYFGAPVTKARVKYKVLRSSHDARWYPHGDWDWMYGRGYWWFAPDYAWFPGWSDWGSRRPLPWWYGTAHEAPEVVAENEVSIDADGTVKIPIDTRPAKELHPNQDHQYSITAEVVDESRRTIVGSGSVLVARKPFQVNAWVDRGHYRSGDTIKASFAAHTLDQKPVQGQGELTLYRIRYDDNNEPVEKAVQTWKLDTSAQGRAHEQIKAAEPGQYRLSYRLTDAKKNTIEGGYLFVVRGEGFDGHEFRFNDVELVPDRREYAPGDKVNLLINTARNRSTVLLFVRPANGVYLAPRVLRLQGKSTQQAIDVIQKDMPNFFVEALTISNGRIHTEMREVVVPPQKRVLNVAVEPSQQEYRPGQKATVKVRLTDLSGKPFEGSTVLSVYDRSVEYISGGSNVPEIKEFFWKWRRQHHSNTESSLNHYLGNLLRHGETGMSNLGVFGATVIDDMDRNADKAGKADRLRERLAAPESSAAAAPGFAGRGLQQDGQYRRQAAEAQNGLFFEDAKGAGRGEAEQAGGGAGQPAPLQPVVRKNFADTAYWNASLTTDKDGRAVVAFTMPENLTGWKVRVWALGHGTKVGQGEAEVVTKKDLLVRLQAPRFFVEKDEVVLSANVHNYLKADKEVAVSLELEGGTLTPTGPLAQTVSIAAGSEKRVDWRVKVTGEGSAVVRVKAVADVDADAMEMRFPCYVHGMLKMESFTGVIRADKDTLAKVAFSVPAERRVNETRLEVRYSPTLAGAMVDALPYLVDYPYGCTEQTLNRFLPTVITQKVLLSMNLDLKKIQEHRTNLNSQEIGNDKERQKGWKRYDRNPVFDEAEVRNMAKAGVDALAGMQLSDGGWGWFSGYGERSYPHTTATVVHGLQVAKANGVVLPQGMLERGSDWLKNYQAQQLQLLRNFANKVQPSKEHADNIDSLVYMVLVDGDVTNDEMRDYLYRDRTFLTVYAKAMYGLTLFKQQQSDKLQMILKNIAQYVVQDDENQTAYLRLPPSDWWWNWYGSETEANAYYLKLLTRVNPKDERAPRLVKYLLNNRKHATYWNSTRDTSLCLEAFAEYLKASGEDRPDMTVEVWLDGRKHKEVKIDTSNLFTFDNKMVLLGDAVSDGKHVLEIRRTGRGPVYFNAYLTNFTLEDFITKAGLEVRVNRKYYKLTRADKNIKVEGSKGQAADQRVERYQRTELANLAELKSGDLVEIELEIDSKNDYEYLIFEDPKAAGFEPFEVRSGYTRSGLGAYMELRDEKVCFFVRTLARGKHSISYRMRAEIPGRFSALPTRAYAMYAPELKGNSDEIKLRISD